MNKPFRILIVLVLLGSLAACSALETRREKGTAGGAAVGAVAGAVIGQAIGRDTAATVLGAAIGAVVGGVAGHEIAYYMDEQEQKLQAVAARSDEMSLARTENVLTATFHSDVMFDYDSAVLKPGGYQELDRVARVLTEYRETLIRVEGHTDKTGGEEYNQRLSERRANAVKNALIQRNVHPQRIIAVGFGESLPVSSNDAVNRRVNIVIVPVEARG
jgi:outer membrane protein OmpA-like peptidoglycan-associated protein